MFCQQEQTVSSVSNSNDVLKSHQGLVIHIAQKYSNVAHLLGIEFRELLAEGYVGLLEAYNRFDKEKNTKLSTYAVFWIRKRIINTIAKHRSILSGVEYVSSKVSYEQEREQIYEEKGISSETFNDYLKAVNNVISLDGYTTDEEDKKDIYERLYVEGDYEKYERELERRELSEILEEMISKLPYEHREVIRMKYGIGTDPRSLSEIASTLGCSKRRINRIEKEALKMLKKLAKARNLEYFL